MVSRMVEVCQKHNHLMFRGLECALCKGERLEKERRGKEKGYGIGTVIILIAVAYVALKSLLELLAK